MSSCGAKAHGRLNSFAKAGGKSRMHVHVHLISRYEGDVPDPRGGIRCVLAGRKAQS